MNPTVINMIFNMYSGLRHVRVHGAVAEPVVGYHGLIAGCAFAPDLLKCFLGTAALRVGRATFRSYVDDMALLASGENPMQAADRLSRELKQLKGRLRRDGMQLNDLKEQVFGFYESERAAWRLLGGYAAVPQARDLGVIHVAAGRGRGDKTGILATLAQSAARFGMIPGTQCFRAKMVAAVAYGKIMYGIEVNHLTEGVLQRLRKLLLGSIGGSLKYGDVKVAALDFHQGKWEPAIVMARRIFQFWIKEGEMLDVKEGFWKKQERARFKGLLVACENFVGNME
jgi:hypothetical protein